jgi:hypothetical protein
MDLGACYRALEITDYTFQQFVRDTVHHVCGPQIRLAFHSRVYISVHVIRISPGDATAGQCAVENWDEWAVVNVCDVAISFCLLRIVITYMFFFPRGCDLCYEWPVIAYSVRTVFLVSTNTATCLFRTDIW